MRNLVKKVKTNMLKTTIAVRAILSDKRGESAVGTTVSILTAVVLGALILAGLYALLKDQVLPGLTERIREMFDYQG